MTNRVFESFTESAKRAETNVTFQPFKIKELAPILVMMSWIIAKYAALSSGMGGVE